MIDGVTTYHGKEPNEIREELKFALRHWGQYGMVRHKDETNTSKPQLGPRMPLNAEAQKQVYYEAMYHTLSGRLSASYRLCLELYYIKDMDRSTVAQEMEITPSSVTEYCAHALTELSDMIWRTQNHHCSHCGMAAVLVNQDASTLWKEERKCLLCAGTQ